MTQTAIKPRLTFEEYIDFCAQADKRYELVRGELIEMVPPTWMHILIARFLEQTFEVEIKRLGLANQWIALRETGQRTSYDSSRLPDVLIVPLAVIASVLNQPAVLIVPSPLVVEIVSPSSVIEDYEAKLKEYQTLEVKEYWVVDHEGLGAAKHIGFPKTPTLTIYELIEGTYQAKQFRGDELLQSATFSTLSLTANQVFSAGRQM